MAIIAQGTNLLLRAKIVANQIPDKHTFCHSSDDNNQMLRAAISRSNHISSTTLALRASRQSLPRAYHHFLSQYVPDSQKGTTHSTYRHGIEDYVASLRRRSATWRDFVVVPSRYGQGNERNGGNGNGIRGMLGEILGRLVLLDDLPKLSDQFHAKLELLAGPQIGATSPYHPAAKLSDALIGTFERDIHSSPGSRRGIFDIYFEADVKVVNPERVQWMLQNAKEQFSYRWKRYWNAKGKLVYPKHPWHGQTREVWQVSFNKKSGMYRLLLIPQTSRIHDGEVKRGMLIRHLPIDFDTLDATAKRICRESLLTDKRPRPLPGKPGRIDALIQRLDEHGLEFYTRGDVASGYATLGNYFDRLLSQQVLTLECAEDHVNLLRGPNWQQRGFRYRG